MRAARAMLDMTQADVARLAGVSLPTLKRLESQASGPQRANAASIEAVARVYTDKGVRFLFGESDGRMGVTHGTGETGAASSEHQT
ncbi:MAG: helix-turn-helix transcriptional regulator [Gemmobacter sp.]